MGQRTQALHTAITLPRTLKWVAAIVVAPIVVGVLFIAVFGWGWLRAPIERLTLEKTGRVLRIQGDMDVTLAWPWPRLHAKGVSFANPAWSRQKQMLVADAVDLTIDLPQLLQGHLVLPELRLQRPVVFLERASGGRKSWLLDLNQQDEDSHIRMDRLTLDGGLLGYDDAAQETSIRAELSTAEPPVGGAAAGLIFAAHGQYHGLPLKATGKGGPVLMLRDDHTPYPLTVDATIGHTSLKAQGNVIALFEFSAADMRLALRGDSMAQLFPLSGIALPDTPAYQTEGHLRHSGNNWAYEKFTGKVGSSDLQGSLQIAVGDKPVTLTAELTSDVLDLADLGPLIGAKPGSMQAARRAAPAVAQDVTPSKARVLPDMPFNTEHWNSVNAEVGLRAKTIRRAKELPLENLTVHLSLRDSVLKLDPLDFGLAGGSLQGDITLDGRKDPIQVQAQVLARKIVLARLFPAFALNKSSVGQVNGEFKLFGHGNSVAKMLATAQGKVGLVVSGGEVSRLMMEKAGLHLWEILQLNLRGDEQIKLRCVVADFDVQAGKMKANALIFDTQVTTLIGTGTIDLAQEQLDLRFNQKTKNTSPLALRSPIHIRGSFARPDAGVDKVRVAQRALGALALGFVYPVLALLPLIDAGPGQDSNCAQLVRDARAPPRPAKKGMQPDLP